MTTQQVADRLVELCRAGQLEQAQKELYADNITSLEPNGMMNQEVHGIAGVTEKGKQFQSMVEEFYGQEISDPIVAGSYFTLSWMMDVKMKNMDRMKMNEICVYRVKDSKIVYECFYFDMPGSN